MSTARYLRGIEFRHGDGTELLVVEGWPLPPCPGKGVEPEPTERRGMYALEWWLTVSAETPDGELRTPADIDRLRAIHESNAKWFQDTTPREPVQVPRDDYESLCGPESSPTWLPVAVRRGT